MHYSYKIQIFTSYISENSYYTPELNLAIIRTQDEITQKTRPLVTNDNNNHTKFGNTCLTIIIANTISGAIFNGASQPKP